MKRIAMLVAALAAVSLLETFAVAAEAAKTRAVVMYFHRTQRCPTCLKMGSYTEEAVQKGFETELKTGQVSLHFIDFQDAKNAEFTKAYEVSGPTLIVAKAVGENVVEYKDLSEMWTKVRDKQAFLEYVRSHVKTYLK